MAVNFGVRLVEALARLLERFAVERILPKSAQRYTQLVALPGIAHVEIALEHGGARVEAFFGKLARRLGFDLAKELLGVRRIEPVERAKLGADVVVQHIGAEQAKRGKRTGPRRHDDA